MRRAFLSLVLVSVSVLLADGAGGSVGPALPTVVTGSEVTIYATFPTDPGGLSFDASDNLFVGNFNNPGPPNGPANLYRVSAVDSVVTVCVSTIDDPDAVYVDRNGILGSAGDILVGGWDDPTSIGQITRVFPGCSGTAAGGFGGCLGNISDFAEDSLGRLYINNATELTICVYQSGSWSTFLPAQAAFPHIAVNSLDVFVSVNDQVKRYDTGGTLIESSFARGLVLGFGPPGPFEGLIVFRSDSLLAVDPVSKNETLILTGPNSGGSDVAFNSSGDLFLSQGASCDRVLRVRAGTQSAVEDPQRSGALRVSVSPNPFVRGTTITWVAPDEGPVLIEVFNVHGEPIRTLRDEFTEAGLQNLDFQGPDLPPGVYFLQVRMGGLSVTRKLTLMR